ncbi:MAG: phage tail protein, partial [Dysosmobacter sp.]|nr:phage tail protein [Dysosmobacter sp.]
MNRGITKENLLLIAPPALRHDKSIMALAEADAEALAARLAEIDRVRIISNIDGLEEAVLDILARDFKVDWWDPEYSLEEKRRTLKGNWKVHKTLGTKAAVSAALSAIYP